MSESLNTQLDWEINKPEKLTLKELQKQVLKYYLAYSEYFHFLEKQLYPLGEIITEPRVQQIYHLEQAALELESIADEVNQVYSAKTLEELKR